MASAEASATPAAVVESSCVNCDRPDSFDNMVQCDTCNSWWHQCCAGVTGSVAERPWNCRQCSNEVLSIRTTSSTSRSARIALQVEKLKEQRELERKFIDDKYKLLEAGIEDEENTSQRSRVNRPASIDRVRRWIGENASHMEGAVGRAATATLPPSSLNQGEAAAINTVGPIPTVHKDQQVCSPLRHPSILSGRNPIQASEGKSLPPAVPTHGAAGIVGTGGEHVLQVEKATQLVRSSVLIPAPANNQPLGLPPAVVNKGAIPKVPSNQLWPLRNVPEGKNIPNPPVHPPPGKPHQSQPKRLPAESNKDNGILHSFIKQLENMIECQSMPIPPSNTAPPTRGTVPNYHPQPNVALPFGDVSNPILGGNEYTPTPSQLAARQVMPRDLPQFSGNPTEWPVFISSFQNSTLACGYTHAENLCRLQRSLKGAAYEAVQSRLLLPASIPHVMDTLYLLYGRPELLIHALLEKVRSVPAPKTDRLETLIDFGMAVQSLCDHLEAANQLAHLSNPSLLMELVGKLPAHVKMEWGTYLRNFPDVNLKTFGNFMSDVVISASKVTVYSGISGRTASGDKSKPKNRGAINAHSNEMEEVRTKEILCYACKKPGHRLQDCGTFKSLTVDDRWKCVQANRLCRNCLCSHGKRSCRRTSSCGTNGCPYRHHPMLHSTRTGNAFNRQLQPATGENHTHRQMEHHVFFRIIPVMLFGPSGIVNTFAFLDDGSSLTLIEEELVEQLGIEGESRPLCLMWTGNVTRNEKESKQVSLSISATGSHRRYALDDARTVKELCLPRQTLSYGVLENKYDHLRGLPVTSYVDAVPRLLIGINNLNLMVPVKVKEGNIREPVAAKTRLGWCIYGGHGEHGSRQTLNCHSCSCTNDEDLHNTVKHFFDLEEVATKSTIILMSEEEKRAQRILEETTVRIGNRYATGLLWKFDHIKFPDSYSMALRRLQCLEKRMDRDPKLRENLRRQLLEYQEKGYTHRATEAELASADKNRIWYLPLGVVVNPRKPEKVRLIWDAAAKVGGISLNSFLLKGPDQLTSLPAVLVRFRQFMVAVSADIKEMFHQILMRLMDRHSLRFLWRSDPSSPPEIFMMDVAIFGSACSPASAQFVKNKNAKEFEDQYPRAVEGIINNHYVDDSLESYASVHEAVRVSEEMRMIHENGGFQLRNWLSNSEEVLHRLGEKEPSGGKNISLDRKEYERVLGLLWLTKEDKLCLSMEVQQSIQRLINEGGRPTKRQVLKCLMGFFDPLGLWSVFLVHGKILLQDVWRSGTQWDEKINDAAFERWRKWTNLFQNIREIRIPRCYFENATNQHYKNLQLYIFVDASEAAYSAAAYFRITKPDGLVDCSLVVAKTKVAPLKPLSIPRLELQAAVLGVRLMQFVEESHTVKVQQRFLWSDSATVLAWLRSDHRRYKQFVACRVGELLTASDVREWHWVPSKHNPADLATKFGKGSCEDVSRVWFNGPGFLKDPESEWPRQRTITVSTEEELRPCHAHCKMFIPEMVFDLERFSRLSRLIRSAAYVHRWIANRRRRTKGEAVFVGHLRSEELLEGQRMLIRLAQWQVFTNEMVLLTRNQQSPAAQQIQLEKSSELYKLTPMLDEFGILRMDGRITAAPNVNESVKFPIILPRKYRLTYLLLDDYHRRFRHCNMETVVNEVRQHFHIPQLRVAVKQVAKSCQWCRTYKTEPCIPRMAPLPAARVTSFQRPFTNTGLDLFGPLLVKIGRSNTKRWIAVFTCLTIRAVHVEVVHSLSTRSCVEAIRRFVVRRGSPATIYSDNGTNFREASRLLQEQIEQLATTFTSSSTKWIFIPPGTPHMGGAWERMVRSIKTAMDDAYSIHGKLNDETLVTLVVEVEGIVNSRPLTYLPISSEESEALTPNHFLLGSSSGVRQQAEADDSVAVLQASFHQIQQHLDTFWRRWLREYLPTLNKRTKWFGDVKPVAAGDLVVIVDESTRNRWERGRILEVIRGSDGRIRQAIVQTARGLIRRSVGKLAVLEVDGEGKTESDDRFSFIENNCDMTEKPTINLPSLCDFPSPSRPCNSDVLYRIDVPRL
ncbi:uncharacterized protein LOC129761441 [Toxorhynchites rutilus septentrionalis]|uniref:uncharacterized protein LOC129761441 n=1 Tax=Toxorhynchites rutilus septentrionalis TaxID=329112 RepID=UPI00247A2A44|nr:uncharacterized protein LOC129761441 [Toxorhynchites rutilus septentrionalis]